MFFHRFWLELFVLGFLFAFVVVLVLCAVELNFVWGCVCVWLWVFEGVVALLILKRIKIGPLFF